MNWVRTGITTIVAALSLLLPTVARLAQADEAPSWPDVLRTAPRLGTASIASFDGILVLPPPDTALLGDLQVAGAGVDGDVQTGQPVYKVVLGTQFGANATFTGSRGRALFDARSRLPDDCNLSDTYCATDNGYIVAGPPTNEYFAGLAVGDEPALVRHVTCCNGEYWSVDWYATKTDTSYRIDLALDIAGRLGASGVDPSNIEAAGVLTELASTLVPIRLTAEQASGGTPPGQLLIKTAPRRFSDLSVPGRSTD